MMRMPSKKQIEMLKDLLPYYDEYSEDFKVVDDAPESIKREADEYVKLLNNNPIPEGWG